MRWEGALYDWEGTSQYRRERSRPLRYYEDTRDGTLVCEVACATRRERQNTAGLGFWDRQFCYLKPNLFTEKCYKHKYASIACWFSQENMLRI